MSRPVSLGLRISSYLILLFIYLPIILVAIFSFNNSNYSLAWSGFTWKWYGKILGLNEINIGMPVDQLTQATENTLFLAVVSTLIATVLGTLLGYGLHRYKFPGSRFFTWFMYIPVVTPDIVMAVSLLLTYAFLRQLSSVFDPGMTTMVIAHVTFQIAFVAIIVRSRLALLDPALEEAARDLYAGPLDTVRYVILPLAMPGIVAGALLAFTLSIDDFVISFFTSGPSSQTLADLDFHVRQTRHHAGHQRAVHIDRAGDAGGRVRFEPLATASGIGQASVNLEPGMLEQPSSCRSTRRET